MGRQPVKVASVDDTDRLSDEWTDEILACRSGILTHMFEDYDSYHNKRFKFVRITLRCIRCNTLKSFELDEYGNRIGGSVYSYEPGYTSKGHGRILGDAKALVRRKAIERVIKPRELTAREAREDQVSPTLTKRLEQRGS